MWSQVVYLYPPGQSLSSNSTSYCHKGHHYLGRVTEFFHSVQSKSHHTEGPRLKRNRQTRVTDLFNAYSQSYFNGVVCSVQYLSSEQQVVRSGVRMKVCWSVEKDKDLAVLCPYLATMNYFVCFFLAFFLQNFRLKGPVITVPNVLIL